MSDLLNTMHLLKSLSVFSGMPIEDIPLDIPLKNIPFIMARAKEASSVDYFFLQWEASIKGDISFNVNLSEIKEKSLSELSERFTQAEEMPFKFSSQFGVSLVKPEYTITLDASA